MRVMILAGLLVAGCSTGQNPQNNAPKGGADTCNAAAYQSLIGQDAVVDLSLPEPKRTFRIGDPVTTDFIAERLNVQLDDTDTIVAITCG
jgi:hypothetical protein